MQMNKQNMKKGMPPRQAVRNQCTDSLPGFFKVRFALK